MNRGELREKILWRLNQDTDSPQFWEEDFINELIDEAYVNFMSNTYTLETSTTLSLLAYQHLYLLASNCLRVLRVFYATTDKVLDPLSWASLQLHDPHWTETTGTRPEYYVFLPPDKIFLYPAVTADSSDAITYYYTKIPSDLLSDTSSPDIPEVFHDAFIDYPLAIALLREGTNTSIRKAAAYYAKYKEKINSLRKFTWGRSPRRVRIRSRF
jgi:hypothetical protein